MSSTVKQQNHPLFMHLTLQGHFGPEWVDQFARNIQFDMCKLEINLRMKYLFTLLLFCLSTNLHSQEVIKMHKEGDILKVPCNINGLSLNCVFEANAMGVTMSHSEVLFMIKNGYLEEGDFIDIEYTSIQNGDIPDGTKLILRELEIGKQMLYYVNASVVHSLDAPLLLGHNLLQQYGKFSVDYDDNSITIENVKVFLIEVFEVDSSCSTHGIGWGYKVFVNSQLYINQPHIPTLTNNCGFSSKEKAMMAAELVVLKIKNDIIPPITTHEELVNRGLID